MPRAAPAVVAALALWLALAVAAGLMLWRERVRALDQAQQDASRLSAVLEENTARSFDSVGIALQGLAGWLGKVHSARNDPAVRELMKAQLQYLPTVRALFVIGPDGRIQHDTDYPHTPDISLADRAYFRQYVEDAGRGNALSPALQSRSGTGWFVASTRRITGADGGFRGIVVGAVQLDSMQRLFRKLQLAPGQVMSLLQPDGKLVATFPGGEAASPDSYQDSDVLTELQNGLREGSFEGSFRTSGPPLNYARVVSYRRLESQPLVVVLSTAQATVLAGWQRAMKATLTAFAAFTLLLALGTHLLLQHRRDQARALAHQAREREARALAEANAKFRTFFEQGRLFSCLLALDGTVLDVNAAALEAGHVRADVVGHRFWECPWWRPSETTAAALAQGVARAVAGESYRCETVFVLADGRQMLLDLLLSPVNGPQGQPLSVAAIGVDTTERKAAESQLRRLADELGNADRHKSEFLATLSHELRNVLAPVQNGMMILDRIGAQVPQAVRTRAMVQRQLGQMRRLVDDLLDVARVSSGKVHLVQEPVDLRQLVSAAAEAGQAFMVGPGHAFEASVGTEPLPVRVDRARIQQVLANLLGNAAKYTPAGGHIRVQSRREGAQAVVEVSDDGLGIPVASQAKVFQMFAQVKGHEHTSQGGLGIGLGLVHKLVALHGGEVELHSDGANRGSTFTVYLPLAEEPSVEHGAGPAQGAGEIPA